jgi:endogenous inhibitor of DNA gyrase (YacG/DUF329 family)
MPRPYVKSGLYSVVRRFTCAVCGRAFTSRHPTARYCGRRCQTEDGAWSYRANRAPRPSIAPSGAG